MLARRPLAPGSRYGLVAGVLGLAADVLYLIVVDRQDDPSLDSSRVRAVAVFLALAAIAALVGSLVPPGRLRLVLLSVAAAALLSWGFLAILTIGLPLVLGGTLATIAASQVAAGPEGLPLGIVSGGATVALVILVLTATGT